MGDYCKYCYLEENGDFPEDVEYLLLEDLEYETDVHVEDSVVVKKIVVPTCLMVDSELGIIGLSQDCDDRPGHEWLFRNIKINYCPMCGRKFEKKGSEDNGHN